MAKYMILCSTSQSYYLVVEAPSAEAAERYYEGCDTDEFIESATEGDWQLDAIYEDDAQAANLVVDELGEPLEEYKVK